MALGTIRIQGGDSTANNTSGSNWVAENQITAVPSFLTKLVVFVPTVIGANRVAWVFDAAAGSFASRDPVIILVCPNGFTTTLDFGDYGKIFKNGIYLVIASNECVGPAGAYLAASNNDAKAVVDYKVK